MADDFYADAKLTNIFISSAQITLSTQQYGSLIIIF